MTSLREEGCRVVLAGSGGERKLCEQIAEMAGLSTWSMLCGVLTLAELVALISMAERVVTNDSAPLHIAESLGTPVTSIFGPTVPEFGFGPRESEKGKYTVYLRPQLEPIQLRKLVTVRVLVLDAMGRPVEGARIAVDGGMPEHGHGLPTQPRVQGSLGGGMYDIEGLRFSMGGWWEVKLAIDSPLGADRVTFNLSL